MHSWQVHTVDGLEKAATDLFKAFPRKRVFAFFGEVLCKSLGVSENVSSPTFALVNQYEDSAGDPVFHFDFYRIEKEQEAIDIGISEYFHSGHFCFVEWSEKILHLLPEDAVNIHIAVNNETRIITTENGGT
jgi:tRNA threonylcarbamoyladenosine biosynthesis protein TsaE